MVTALTAAGVLALVSLPIATASDILSVINLTKGDVPEFKLIKIEKIAVAVKAINVADVGAPGSMGLTRSTTDRVSIERIFVPSNLVMIGGVSFGTCKEPRCNS